MTSGGKKEKDMEMRTCCRDDRGKEWERELVTDTGAR